MDGLDGLCKPFNPIDQHLVRPHCNEQLLHHALQIPPPVIGSQERLVVIIRSGAIHEVRSPFLEDSTVDGIIGCVAREGRRAGGEIAPGRDERCAEQG